MQSQDAMSIQRYLLIRDYHSEVPGVRSTGRPGRKVLFLLMFPFVFICFYRSVGYIASPLGKLCGRLLDD